MIEEPNSEPAVSALGGWEPPGHYDSENNVYVGSGATRASFPASGLGVFESVDTESFWFRHRSNVIGDALARHGVPRGATVLEVGSGSAVVVEYLSNLGYELGAVEPAPGGALRAAQRGASVAFEGTLEEAAFPESAFDVVGMFDVIEHLDDWYEVVVEARRVLRPDGTLVVTVPAFQWLWSHHDDWNEHRRRYSRKQLSSALSEAGFDTCFASYLFLPLLPAALFRAGRDRVSERSSSAEAERKLETQLAPSRRVNTVLSRVLEVERRALDHLAMPIGSSVLALAKPRGVMNQ